MAKKDYHRINTIAVLVSILETRDENINGHSLHILKLADTFYDEMPLSYHLKLNRNDLHLAAILHDIGQSCVPVDTIGKPGKLTTDEMQTIKQHTEVSCAIMELAGGCDKILDGVKYHHERIDGKGYYGLKGKKIPLISRILAILDTFSAVTVSKTYKPARTYEEGITTLKLGMGTQFDAELVEIFASIPESRIKECLDYVNDSVKKLADKGVIL